MSQISQTNGFPLKEVLRLYSIGRKSLYLNYFKEFKLILKWIGPVSTMAQGLTLPDIPWYYGNYELQELAVILGCSQNLILYHLESLRKEQELKDGNT